jgi:hypothetical protein
VTRVFVIYATKDTSHFDRLAEQARTARLPIEFERMQTKLPWVPDWKAQCWAKIYRSDAAVVLISKNTSEGSLGYELESANTLNLPMLGVHVDKFNRGAVPKELSDATIIEWNWPAIARFLQSLGKGSSASV